MITATIARGVLGQPATIGEPIEHVARWRYPTLENWEHNVQRKVDFAYLRRDRVREHFMDDFGIAATPPLRLVHRDQRHGILLGRQFIRCGN
jgi:hypothetical protein